MGDLVRIWTRRSPTRTPAERLLRRAAIAPANTVVKTRPNVGLGDEMAALGYHFLTRRKGCASTSAAGTSIVRPGASKIPRLTIGSSGNSPAPAPGFPSVAEAALSPCGETKAGASRLDPRLPSSSPKVGTPTAAGPLHARAGIASAVLLASRQLASTLSPKATLRRR